MILAEFTVRDRNLYKLLLILLWLNRTDVSSHRYVTYFKLSTKDANNRSQMKCDKDKESKKYHADRKGIENTKCFPLAV